MRHSKGFIDIVLAMLIGAAIVGVGAYLGLKIASPPQNLGATGVVQAQAFYLSGSGITATAATITLTSFKLPDASTTITMSNFSNATGYATIEPGSSKEEQISFTGVTQNADGTATLTGVTRGVNFVLPCDSVTAFKKAHAGGVKLVLSNTACFYSQFPSTNSTATISAVYTFSSATIPQLDSYKAPTLNAQFAPKQYVDSVATSGAPDAGFGTKGLVDLGTQGNLNNASSSGATSAKRVVPIDYYNATSSATTTVPITNKNGKLSQGFLDLTQAFTFSGGVTSTGAFNQTASSTFASSSFSGAVTFNGTTTTFTNGVAGTFRSSLLDANTLVKTVTASTATTTLATSSVSALTLTTSTVLRGKLFFSTVQGGGSGENLSMNLFYGSNLIASSSFSALQGGTEMNEFDFTIIGGGSASQTTVTVWNQMPVGGLDTLASPTSNGYVNTTSVDTSVTANLTVTARWSSTNVSNTYTTAGYYLERLYP